MNKKQKAKKLELKKETIRTLTETDLVKVNGGWYASSSNMCSTALNSKCGTTP